MDKSLTARVIEAQMSFSNTKYESTVTKAWNLLYGKTVNESEAAKLLDTLPTVDTLLAELVEKLKGKRVYETIRKIVAREIKDSEIIVAKGLSSLLTHVIIECELAAGKSEYKVLIPITQERLNEAIYNSLLKGPGK